jgi:hypothetical protein
MPASHKMLKSREQAQNRANGIGDEQGRMPSRVKDPEVKARCTVCSLEIRVTKKNIEAKAHWESRHPTITYAACWPGLFDPSAPAAPSTDDATSAAPAAAAAAAPAAAPKKKAAQDLSFLDAALDPKKKK